jgi:ParB-like chromosome segregation protein Spo0J
MGVDFESSEKITRDSTYYIATQDIKIDSENNGRHVLPDIAWLVESIETNGQRVPCIVRKDGLRAVMVDGHNRWRAICEINKKRKVADRLKVRCEYFRGNEVDALEAGYIANRHNPLQPVDQGYFVARMLRFGKTIEQIAEICREDVAWCNKRLELVSLTPEARDAVSKGDTPLTAARALAKLAAEEQRRFLKSGKKITPAAVRKFAAPAAPKPKVDTPPATAAPPKPKPTLANVLAILQDIAINGKYPKGITEVCTKACLCEWLIDYIEGE